MSGYEQREQGQLQFKKVPIELMRAHGLDASAFVVLMALISRENGGVCFPSMATIAKDANVSVKTVQRAVSLLEQRGYITIKKRYKKNGKRRESNYYVLNIAMYQDEESLYGQNDHIDSEYGQNDPPIWSNCPPNMDNMTGVYGQNDQVIILSELNKGIRLNELEVKPVSRENDVSRNAIEKEFEHFWQLYPRKDGSKEKAFISFRRLRKTTSLETILNSLDEYINEPGRNDAHTRGAARWLKSEPWRKQQEQLQEEPTQPPPVEVIDSEPKRAQQAQELSSFLDGFGRFA